MRSIKLQKSYLIKLIYGVVILVFILSTTLPYYLSTYIFPLPPDPPLYNNTSTFWGYIELIYGGWIGLVLIALSAILLKSEGSRNAVIIGISGCVLIGFNLIFRTSFQRSTDYHTISIQPGLYLGFTFWIALCVVNGYVILEEEGLNLLKRVKSKEFKPIVKQKIKPRFESVIETTPVQEEEQVIIGTDWERKELISKQTIDYIKKAQLKSKELPFIEIISKTGIKKETLDAIVDEMIDKKEINARVLDFVIIFKKIPEAVKEELLKKIQKEISQKFSEVDDLIAQNRFDKAIKILHEIRDTADSANLIEFVFKAKEKIDQCKELEIEKKEELQKQKIKDELLKEISNIKNLIESNDFKNAFKELDKVKKVAKEHNLLELLEQIEKLKNRCREQEEEFYKEKELLKIERKVQKRITSIEKLIEKKKILEALEELVEIKEISQKNNYVELLKIIEEKIDYCKHYHIDIINKIKNTIFNYGSKLARLELIDISEKSGIQDEKLIEKIILDMINNRELNAEYFSSSKSIAFYQEDKETVPKKGLKESKQLKVFLSYSTLDAEHFQISDIVKRLEKYPDIKKVSYWQADSKQNIVEFMEDTLKNTDIFVLFCSANSVKSGAVKDEWQAAFQMRKKGMLKIIPVYEDEDHIPVLLWQMLNVKFTKDDFNGFVQNLYAEILR